MPFTAPDGTEFAAKPEFRDYMMNNYFSFKNKRGQTLMKQPGDVDGQVFDIADCSDSELVVLDWCEQVSKQTFESSVYEIPLINIFFLSVS